MAIGISPVEKGGQNAKKSEGVAGGRRDGTWRGDISFGDETELLAARGGPG